jgi:hypothetical protein
MLSRRSDEAHSVLVLADGDVLGGAGFAEAGADTVKLGADGGLLGWHGGGVKQPGRTGEGQKERREDALILGLA